MSEVPVWERYTLTVEEAAQYFHIGENKLRQIMRDNADADYILQIGNRTLIKRKKFEQYIDKCSVI